MSFEVHPPRFGRVLESPLGFLGLPLGSQTVLQNWRFLACSSSQQRRAGTEPEIWKVKTIFKPRQMPPCRSCDKEWTFEVLEQAFYAERGYKNDPSRCRDCRAERQKDNPPQARTSQGRDNRETSHTGTCDDCGGQATVPFKPRPDRPLLCRNCYGQQRRAG